MDEDLSLLTVSGTIAAVIFYNSDNGYSVIRLKNEDRTPEMPGDIEDPVICVGIMAMPAPGQEIECQGKWEQSKSYGLQFAVSSCMSQPPFNEADIFEYLSSGIIKGIGNATARLIVDKFGRDSLDVIESDPERLATVKGITKAKAQAFSDSYREISSIKRLLEFLTEKGVRAAVAMRLYRFYGEESMVIVERDPYVIATSLIGGSFSEADSLALNMGFDEDSDERIKAACIYELTHNLNNGHCFVPYNALVSAAAALIHVEPERVSQCIDELGESGRIVIDTEYSPAGYACYLPELYEAECYVAQRLSQMTLKKVSKQFDAEPAIDLIEKENGISYAPEQRRTLSAAMNNNILIITGGPGTGKTTTVRGILSLFDMAGIKTLLCAPTGRAAKRMSELSGREASTIHRLLGAQRSEDLGFTSFTKNEDDQLSCDAVILDESSMVDMLLMSALLRALPKNARLICVGDSDQLPPVGPGRVFTAMINSGVFPTVKLTEIFRQSQGSMIVKNAHLINAGVKPEMSQNTGDFFRLSRDEGASSIETVVDLCANRLPNKLHLAIEDIQVLSPSRKGELGTIAINDALQKILNPQNIEKKEKLYGNTVFREGDRVMQVKNNYDITWTDRNSSECGLGIYNGDIGYIRRIDNLGEYMEIDFDGKVAIYAFSWLNELEHAWAITVHKSQGCEFKAVILALSTFSKKLLTRTILYTAVTRARDLLIIVGKDQIADVMISENTVSRRFTYLRQRILKAAGAG